MGTLLRVVMYVVALAAGVDTSVIGPKFLVDQWGMSGGWARVTAVVVGAILALFLATVPIAIYQRVMRRIVAQRRAAARARLLADPLAVWPERADIVEPSRIGPRIGPRTKEPYGVIYRENRSLAWPASDATTGKDAPGADEADPIAC